MSERIYNEYTPYDRPKLPRNKYGLIDFQSITTSSSLFGGGSAEDYTTSPVGFDMASLKEYVGATRTEDGIRGLVPAPLAGQNDYFLKGSGGWAEIPAFKWIKEFPEGRGFEKTGITVKGDLNVEDTITTMNLNVQGQAHFWELIIDKVKATGGQLIVSPSLFHIDYVGPILYINPWDAQSPMSLILQARQDINNMFTACNIKEVKCRRLYMRCDDGERRTENECQIGDMMRCRSFNLRDGVYHNVKNLDYWTFVVDKGEEPYQDEDGEVHEAFYIDVAYALRLQNGHNIPLGSKLHIDGTIDIPEGYTEVDDALDLKRVSYKTLTGSTDINDEIFDSEEWDEVTNAVVDIHGFMDRLSNVTDGL